MMRASLKWLICALRSDEQLRDDLLLLVVTHVVLFVALLYFTHAKWI